MVKCESKARNRSLELNLYESEFFDDIQVGGHMALSGENELSCQSRSTYLHSAEIEPTG